MKPFSPQKPICFISPHLDDVVLSCGYFLHKNPGATVVTVLAGAPKKFTDANEWNARTTGEFYAPDAMRKRRREDNAALSLLGAKPIYLDGWDLPYLEGQHREEAELYGQIEAILKKSSFKSVVMPIGFHHPDHTSVGNVCRKIAKKLSAEIYFFLDLPYGIGFPEKAKDNLAKIEKLGKLEELKPVEADGDVKDRAFRLYRSQYEAIRKEFEKSGVYDKALNGPEHYWRLTLA